MDKSSSDDITKTLVGPLVDQMLRQVGRIRHAAELELERAALIEKRALQLSSCKHTWEYLRQHFGYPYYICKACDNTIAPGMERAYYE